MTPFQLKYGLDVMTLLIGIYVMLEVSRAALGGTVGTAFKLVLIGIFVLTINHFLDTVYLADTLKMMGHTQDFFQAPIVHRAINFVGFLFMAWGFSTLPKIKK